MMNFIKKLFGGSKAPATMDKQRSFGLAFVLLSEATLPDEGEVIASYGAFSPDDKPLRVGQSDGPKDEGQEVLVFDLGHEQTAFVALMPVSIPTGEAEEAANFSLSSMGTGWKLPEHCAHLMVTLTPSSSLTNLEEVSRFTSFLAAVTKVSKAVGVYWGNAGATHDPRFFSSVAEDQGVIPRITLWTGVSMARESDGRLSLLSLGIQNLLQLPDLLVVAPSQSGNDVMEVFFDLLAYQVDRGEAVPDGDTIGRSSAEKLTVRYVRSPIDKSREVWRIELEN